MKNVLITGENSYVGNSFAEWVKNDSNFVVEKISLRNNTWREKDFSKFDVVLHVAGIAHQKETKENKELYYQVNRDLAIEIAKKAKKYGVPQFVFLSSMSVYGMDKGIIDENTLLKPKTNYGKSKLEAEKNISDLETPEFKIAIIRPPMIYGRECKGNYVKLSKLSNISPLFPDIDNKRSMIYVNNLSEYIKLIINECLQGIYFPQNKEYVSTKQIYILIRKINKKKYSTVGYFNWLINLCDSVGFINKVFGDLYYSKSLDQIDQKSYVIYDLSNSIKETESKRVGL